MDQQTGALQFPCQFPIKAFGRKDTPFDVEVLNIIRRHVTTLPDEAVTLRASQQGNYIAMTVVIEAVSQEQLDAVYREISACKLVVMAL